MSDASYRGRHRPPAGRHRAPESRPAFGLPRLTGSGYLLPTAAAATLVLTATGAHLGGSANAGISAAQTLTSAIPQSSPSPLGTATLEAAVRGQTLDDTIERSTLDRAARSSSRGATDAVPGDAQAEANAANTANSAAGAQADAQAQAADDKAAADAAASVAQQAAQQAASDAQVQADTAAAAQAQADAVKAQGHSWVAPITVGYTLTSGFGMRWGSMHPGQDFAIPVGSTVRAMSSGTVIFAGWSGGYGNKVEIQYWDGTVSWYAHNSKLLVNQGDAVTPGETVSLSGNTGHSTGPHLHVEIHPGNGTAVPPLPWLQKMGNMP